VQIFSEEITEDLEVVAVLPHPMSSPDVASPAYYYFKSLSTGREIPPSEIANLPAIRWPGDIRLAFPPVMFQDPIVAAYRDLFR
jgi:hypothetical protein